ncbi:hypothetical protein IW261DRAFT_1590435, partial [Armillaria novae-zelandiae]
MVLVALRVPLDSQDCWAAGILFHRYLGPECMYFGSFQCSLLTMYSGSGMSRKAWGVMMSKTSPCTTAIATLVFLIFFVFPE